MATDTTRELDRPRDDAATERTPDELALFAATARRRREARMARWAERRRRGWVVARAAAALLRAEYGAERVVVFGSLLHPEWFGERSDVDLAVWGLPGDRYFRAVAAVNDIEGAFGVDLVEPAQCRPGLRAAIESEGVEL